MRWKWLIPRLLIVTVIWLAITFGFDPFVRYTAVESLQSLTGARADIDRVSTGFFPPLVSVERVSAGEFRYSGNESGRIRFADVSSGRKTAAASQLRTGRSQSAGRSIQYDSQR